jgi:hypothetical protein
VKLECPAGFRVNDAPLVLRTAWHTADHLRRVHLLALEDAVAAILRPLDARLDQLERDRSARGERKAEAKGRKADRRAARDVAPSPRFDVECSLRSCGDEPIAVGVLREDADAAVAAHRIRFPSHTPGVQEVPRT